MKRSPDFFLVSLLATCLWALLGLPAAWLELREDPHHCANYGEKLFAFQIANAAVAGVVCAAGWRAARLEKGRPIVSFLAGAWAVALLLVQPSLLSPQSTTLVLCQTASILFLIAVSVCPVRWLTGLHLSFLAVASVLLLVEAYVGLVARKRLPDYGQVMGSPQGAPFNPGGLLKPDLDLEVLGDGPEGVVRVVTNSAGFRSRREFAPLPSGSVTRILFAGDSFFAGYRVDQEDSVGAVLEKRLNENAAAGVEMLISNIANPALCWLWLEKCGFAFDPDLLVLGVTLGNDLGECWLALHPQGAFRLERGSQAARIEWRKVHVEIGFRTPPLSDQLLPADAFARHPNPFIDRLALYRRTTLAKLSRLQCLGSFGWSGALQRGIASWYNDLPRRVHVFDIAHGLGVYYSRSSLAAVDEAFERLEDVLLGIRSACETSDVALLVVLIPQRFQISETEWERTCRRYGLDPGAFDLEQPNRRLRGFFEEHAFEWVDLSPAFRERATPSEPLYLPQGDMHWNRHGHHLAGEVLAAILRERGLLSSRR